VCVFETLTLPRSLFPSFLHGALWVSQRKQFGAGLLCLVKHLALGIYSCELNAALLWGNSDGRYFSTLFMSSKQQWKLGWVQLDTRAPI
jgi:hypothetical protein